MGNAGLSGSLDLDALAGRDRLVEITVDGDRRSFPIPGSLLIPQMIRLLVLETRFNDSVSGASDEHLGVVLGDMYTEILDVIRVRTPDAPDLELNQEQLLGLMAYMSGDDSVAEAVAAQLVREDAAPAASVPRTEEEVAAAGGTPFDSETHSPSISSGSDASTDGDPSGGVTSPGEPSDSISEMLTPV